jgi:hypothetical protein
VLFNAIKEQINIFLLRHEKEKIDDVSTDRIVLLKKLRKLEKGKGRKGEVCSKTIDGCLEFLIIQETNRRNELEKIQISSSDEDEDDEDDADYDPKESENEESGGEEGAGEDGDGEEGDGEEGDGEEGDGKRKEGEGEDGDGKREEGEGEDGDGANNKETNSEGDNVINRFPTADEADDECVTPPPEGKVTPDEDSANINKLPQARIIDQS